MPLPSSALMAAPVLGLWLPVAVLGLGALCRLAPRWAFTTAGHRGPVQGPPRHPTSAGGSEGISAEELRAGCLATGLGLAAAAMALAARRGRGPGPAAAVHRRFGPLRDQTAKEIRELERLQKDGFRPEQLNEVESRGLRRWMARVSKVWQRLTCGAAPPPREVNLRRKVEAGLEVLREREAALLDRLGTAQAGLVGPREGLVETETVEASLQQRLDAVRTSLAASAPVVPLAVPRSVVPELIEAAEVRQRAEGAPASATWEALTELEEVAHTHEDTTKKEIRALELLMNGSSAKEPRNDGPFSSLRKAGAAAKEKLLGTRAARAVLEAMQKREAALLASIEEVQRRLMAEEDSQSSAAGSWPKQDWRRLASSEQEALKALRSEVKAVEDLEALANLSHAHEDTTVREIRALQMLAGESVTSGMLDRGLCSLRKASRAFRTRTQERLEAMWERESGLLEHIRVALERLNRKEELQDRMAPEAKETLQAVREPQVSMEPEVKEEPVTGEKQPVLEEAKAMLHEAKVAMEAMEASVAEEPEAAEAVEDTKVAAKLAELAARVAGPTAIKDQFVPELHVEGVGKETAVPEEHQPPLKLEVEASEGQGAPEEQRESVQDTSDEHQPMLELKVQAKVQASDESPVAKEHRAAVQEVQVGAIEEPAVPQEQREGVQMDHKMREEVHRWEVLVERQEEALDQALDVAEELQADLEEVRASEGKLKEELQKAQELCENFLAKSRRLQTSPSSYRPLSTH